MSMLMYPVILFLSMLKAFLVKGLREVCNTAWPRSLLEGTVVNSADAKSNATLFCCILLTAKIAARSQ